MNRTVSASIDVSIRVPARLVIQLAVAAPETHGVVEAVTMTLDGSEVDWLEVAAPHEGRLWILDVARGSFHVDYFATINARSTNVPVTPQDEAEYLRPSRYCESDRLAGFALGQFGKLEDPHERVVAVSSWVASHLEYRSGSSGPSDSAIDTILDGQGVCRDFAHVTVALLRALEVPARVVAAYAPGLAPMDLHAVSEVLLNGEWYVVDSTCLAPRSALVRIATGRDSADTSFLSDYYGDVALEQISIGANASEELPEDDSNALVQLL